MYNHHYYNKNLKEFARELRSESVSKAEKRIWKAFLSRKQFKGLRFLRQRPIDYFIVDFFCPELKLIIEIDGNSHFQKPEYDSYRQERLKSLGFESWFYLYVLLPIALISFFVGLCAKLFYHKNR